MRYMKPPPPFKKQIEIRSDRAIMGVIGFMHTYNVEFLIFFTNHLLLRYILSNN